MARYAKIDVRVWGDEKVKRMTPIPPCGQGLWIRLLVSRHRSPIPGLLCVGEAALAEEFKWPIEAFREAFREAYAQGLVEADWEAGIVWLPNAKKYNRPESPNVVKSWKVPWDETPECELKTKIFQELKAFLEGFAEGFRKAFAKACVEPSAKPLANQEQDPDQDLSLSLPRDPSSTTPVVPRAGAEKPSPYNLVHRFLAIRAEILGIENGKGVSLNPTSGELKKAGELLAAMDEDQVHHIERVFRLACQHAKARDPGWTHEAITSSSFLFGSVISKWRDLLEEIHGCAPKVAAKPPREPTSTSTPVTEW